MVSPTTATTSPPGRLPGEVRSAYSAYWSHAPPKVIAVASAKNSQPTALLTTRQVRTTPMAQHTRIDTMNGKSAAANAVESGPPAASIRLSTTKPAANPRGTRTHATTRPIARASVVSDCTRSSWQQIGDL